MCLSFCSPIIYPWYRHEKSVNLHSILLLFFLSLEFDLRQHCWHKGSNLWRKNMFAKGILIFCLLLTTFENIQATKHQVQLIAKPSAIVNNIRPHSKTFFYSLPFSENPISITEKFYEVFINRNRTKRSVEEDVENGSGSAVSSKEFGEKKIAVGKDKKKGLRHFVPGRPHIFWSYQKVQHFPNYGPPSRPHYRWVRKPEFHFG